MSGILGLILAGGRARRMGGGDKALLPVGGRPMLDRVIERLRPQCAALLLNANGDPDRFADFGLPVVPDGISGFEGPLAGILAGLDQLAVLGGQWLVSVPVDTPFVPLDLVRRLAEVQRVTSARMVHARSAGRTHWACGLWDLDLRDELRRMLGENSERKVGNFVARFPNAAVEWATEPFDPFFNVNTREDLETAEALLRDAGPSPVSPRCG